MKGRSEPILTDTEFDQLQAEWDRRAQAKKHTNKKSDSLLLRVLECGVCGKPMYRLKGGPGRTVRYRCASHQDRVNGPCENGTVPLTEADKAVESFVLKTLGDSKRMERTWDPGEDPAVELEEVNRALEDLVGQLGLGAFRTGTSQRAALDRRIEELAARQEELSSSVTRASGWVWKSTGERFADWWDGLTIPERNNYLRDMGVRAEVRAVRRSDEFNLSVELGQLDRMVEQLEIDTSAVPSWRSCPSFAPLARSARSSPPPASDSSTPIPRTALRQPWCWPMAEQPQCGPGWPPTGFSRRSPRTLRYRLEPSR